MERMNVKPTRLPCCQLSHMLTGCVFGRESVQEATDNIRSTRASVFGHKGMIDSIKAFLLLYHCYLYTTNTSISSDKACGQFVNRQESLSCCHGSIASSYRAN